MVGAPQEGRGIAARLDRPHLVAPWRMKRRPADCRRPAGFAGAGPGRPFYKGQQSTLKAKPPTNVCVGAGRRAGPSMRGKIQPCGKPPTKVRRRSRAPPGGTITAFVDQGLPNDGDRGMVLSVGPPFPESSGDLRRSVPRLQKKMSTNGRRPGVFREESLKTTVGPPIAEENRGPTAVRPDFHRKIGPGQRGDGSDTRKRGPDGRQTGYFGGKWGSVGRQ